MSKIENNVERVSMDMIHARSMLFNIIYLKGLDRLQNLGLEEIELTKLRDNNFDPEVFTLSRLLFIIAALGHDVDIKVDRQVNSKARGKFSLRIK